jgi:hypothetical protein
LVYILINFECRSDHTIEKIVLFRSTQGSPFQHVPFENYKDFSETPDFGQLTLNQSENHMGWDKSTC